METTENIKWPEKTRELESHHFDSGIWNEFKFRDDDIIISTYGKSGTTWVQQIIGQLLFNGAEDIPVPMMSPWLDLRIPPRHVKLEGMEGQKNRRFIKTHLPVDALVFSPKAKYVYVARDGRDVLWSLYNHHAKANDLWYEKINESPGRVGPPIGKPNPDVVAYFNEWLEKDGFPFWSYWDNIKSWWEVRNLPNVNIIHYAELKKDMAGEIRKLAAYLEIPIDESKWEDIMKHCGFEYMKANAEKSAPLGGIFWEGGGKTFMNKGTNGRWKEMLSADESQRYEDMCVEKLGADCAAWLNGTR